MPACRGKKRYESEGRAILALRFLFPRGKRRGCLMDHDGAGAYYCASCAAWHVGHTDRDERTWRTLAA